MVPEGADWTRASSPDWTYELLHQPLAKQIVGAAEQSEHGDEYESDARPAFER